jgi:hypothetical protein
MKNSTLLLLIFGGVLAALAVWSIVAASVVQAEVQSAASTNPLLTLLTGGK